MITILPITDSIRKDQILQTVQGAEDNAEILVMSEAGKESGYVVIDIKASTVRMLRMEQNSNQLKSNREGLMLADSLMRAAASYGASVGAYQIESLVEEWQEYYQSAGFLFLQNRLLCPLEKIVKVCNH